MASSDSAAQFQEPPTAPTPAKSNPSKSTASDHSAQFQEPIPSPATDDSTSNQKSTSEKIKEAVKKPFVKDEEMKSPELEAAKEVLETKGLVSP